MEEYQYTDPVTTFLKELYVEFDFEAAQKALKEAEKVVANDFFLDNFGDDFMDNARYLISEAYCRIHQRIDIGCVPRFHLSLGRVLGLAVGLEMGHAPELAGFAIDPPTLVAWDNPSLGDCVKPTLVCSATECRIHANLISLCTHVGAYIYI